MDNQATRFLDLFRELEDRVVILAQMDEEFVSFSRAIDKIHKFHLDPVISEESCYRFLKTASDLRNLLVHENQVCVPSQAFVDKFANYVKIITKPMKALDIATKDGDLIQFGPLTRLKEACRLMADKHLSHVPIVTDLKVRGVFSASSLFQYYYQKGSIKADEETVVKDLIPLDSFQEHLNEEFAFIGPEVPAYSLLTRFAKKKSGEKRLTVLFITDDGKAGGRLLGIITETDLLKLSGLK